MMTTLKITRIWIDDIKKIEVNKVEEFDELELSQCHINIWTTKGEEFELILQAKTAKELEFRKPDESWLSPKLYKGKSMHEEEEV